MKLQKIILAVFGLFLLATAKVEALTYVTVTSTGVCFATNTATNTDEWPYAIVEVRTSTPTTSLNNEARLVLVDSAALTFSQFPFQRPDRQGVTIATQNVNALDYTAGQHIVPPFVIIGSTQGTTSVIGQGQPNVFPVGGPYGYVPRNGFCAAAVNTGAANLFYLTIGFERIPTGGYPRR